MFTPFRRIIKFGWKNFYGSLGLSLATCFILVIVILLITSIFLLKGTSEHLISLLQEKADITIFFKKDATEEDILKIKSELTEKPEVKKVEYVSPQTALEKFKEQHKDNPQLMEAVGLFDNPFLAHLNIQAYEANQYPILVAFLNQADYSNLIEEIDYPNRKLIIEKIFGLTEAVKKVGIVISIVLSVIAVLVAFNTIKLAIYNSRDEIRVQRLVGASNWFIRGPFFVQSVIAGIFSVAFSLLLIVGILYFLSPKISSFLSGFNLLSYFLANFWTILVIQLATSIGLAVISSYIATRKYLEI